MKTMFRVFLAGMFLVIGGGLSLISASEPHSYDINFQIQLRNTVSVQMGATVMVNPRNPHYGLQMLFLNGTGQTANTFKPLAKAGVVGIAGPSCRTRDPRWIRLNFNEWLSMGCGVEEQA